MSDKKPVPLVGRLAVQLKMIDAAQLGQAMQSAQGDARLGDAFVELGFINPAQLEKLKQVQRDVIAKHRAKQSAAQSAAAPVAARPAAKAAPSSSRELTPPSTAPPARAASPRSNGRPRHSPAAPVTAAPVIEPIPHRRTGARGRARSDRRFRSAAGRPACARETPAEGRSGRSRGRRRVARAEPCPAERPRSRATAPAADPRPCPPAPATSTSTATVNSSSASTAHSLPRIGTCRSTMPRSSAWSRRPSTPEQRAPARPGRRARFLLRPARRRAAFARTPIASSAGFDAVFALDLGTSRRPSRSSVSPQSSRSTPTITRAWC